MSRIGADGLSALKARDLARDAGCALGAIYNVFPDLDALIMTVKSRTLGAIDAAMSAVDESFGDLAPAHRLEKLGLTYLEFAMHQPRLWRCLFEHRLPDRYVLPAWYTEQLTDLFRHLMVPLGELFPARTAVERSEMAQALFAGVHGIVALGLDGKLGTVTHDIITWRIRFLVNAALEGAG
jgi:AcrR family transcriptional regulator